MASIGGVSSSNSVSSLMRSANMISGLASGLDTESMIENLVKGYQMKIQQLNQKVTKTEWKQDAYRSIIKKMVGFSDKYTSYSSSTNLMSPSFFSSSVKVETNGKYADKVSASGKTTSDISLDAVKQLATSAQYRTEGNLNNGDNRTITGKEIQDMFDSEGDDAFSLSSLDGSLSVKYGAKTISISFDEVKDAEALNKIKENYAKENGGKEMGEADALAALMNDKLKEEKIVFDNGESETADKRIKFEASKDGKGIQLKKAKSNDGNSITISGASGNVKEKLGLTDSALDNIKKKPITSFDMKDVLGENGSVVRNLSTADYLVEKGAESKNGLTMNIDLDGSTKKVQLPTVTKDEESGAYLIDGKEVSKEEFADRYTEALNKAVREEFKGKDIEVENLGKDGSLKLNFKVGEGSELVVNTDVGDALGIGNASTSYLNTGKTLGDLLGDKLDGLTPVYEEELDEKGNVKLDEDGNPILKKDKDGNPIAKKDKNGDPLYEFKINDKVVGNFSKNSTLSEVMSAINGNKDLNMTVSYSRTTNKFSFTSKETGVDSRVDMGEGLAETMFGSTKVADAGERKFTDSYRVAGMRDGKETISITLDDYKTPHKIAITEDTTMEDVVNSLNNGQYQDRYTFQYNEYSGKIEARNKDTGELANLNMKDEEGKEARFNEDNAPGLDYTAGQDAKFTVTINGETKEMSRSTNTVTIDGMSITMKGTFAAESNDEKVTFTSRTDSDKIIDAIKDFAKDYNEMMSEIKTAYGTMPYQKSDGTFGGYQPLTDEEMEGMSESAIERYEEKAKQGILFGDRTLSGLYDKMSEVFSFTNTADVDALKDAGINLTYDISTGAQSLEIDEEKLRQVLDSDPDRIADVFTKPDGVMNRMKNELDYYSKTTGEPKGVLIQQAGSPLSSLSLLNNQWQSEIDSYNTQIEKWQDKLTSQVDRYTQQFSRLEQLINQMNSQSSALAGMMGG